MSIWENSGHNHGYWTADNEAWYEYRLRQIQAGGLAGQPKSASEWRKLLEASVRAKPVKEFASRINKVCDEFLTGQTSYWPQ